MCFAAEVPLISILPADAVTVGGVHVDQTLGSPLGQLFLSRFGSDNKDLTDFITASGFDPMKDVRELVFASAAANHGPGLVLARGVFMGSGILQAVKAKSGGTISLYGGLEVLDGSEGRHPNSLAFADGSLAIAGEPSMVRAAIDRRNSSSAASPLAARATDLNGRYHAWFVSSKPPQLPSHGKSGPVQSPALQGITQTSGGVFLSTLVRFEGQAVTRSDRDAQALVDVVRLLATLFPRKDTGTGGPDFSALLQGLAVSAESNVVKVSLSIPESDLERIIPNGKKSIRASR